MLLHYGRDVGRRHARKHLGWALDAAVDTAGIEPVRAKAHRTRVLTAEEPNLVCSFLREAYAALADKARPVFKRTPAVDSNSNRVSRLAA